MWEDPPPKRWSLIAAELRSRPGEWALVAENATTATTTYINQGRITAFRPAGAFEARSVLDPRTRRAAKVFARYVGGAE